MPLPLIKLPYLVFKQVLESMRFIDLFILTRCSTKMKRVVKHLVKVRNYEMNMDFTNHFELAFINKSNEKQVEVFVVETLEKYMSKPEMQVGTFPLKLGNVDGIILGFYDGRSIERMLGTFWSNVTEALQEFYNEIMKIFPCPIKSVGIEPVEQYYATIFQWAAGLSIEKVDTAGQKIELHHLQSLNASIISLYDSNLSDQDIQKFLLDLSNNTSNKSLKKLNIGFYRNADYPLILYKLDLVRDESVVTRQDGTGPFVWNLKLANGETGTIRYEAYESNDPNRECWGFEVRIARREANQ